MAPVNGQRLTGQWSIQAGSKLGRLVPGYGLGFACHVARAGAATSSYWATNGPWSTGAGEARFMVNLPALVHRPQSRSIKDLVHLLLPKVWFTCTTWSWLELLSGATQDMVGVVVVGEVVVGAAQRNCLGRGR